MPWKTVWSRLRNPLNKTNPTVDRAKRRLLAQVGITAVSAFAMIALVFGLTAAWYSNVIQMNAITVQSDSWGFTGQITVSTDPITAMPGDSGVIPVRMKNDAKDPVDIRVDVRKDNLSNNMKKRIYCYVEHSEQTADGKTETTRTYLNSKSHYIFSAVPGESELNLTGEADAGVAGGADRIYWQWVYDVLGYYVLGTVTEERTQDADGQEVITGKLLQDAGNVPEYLMPVEYDLDTAEFDGAGDLKSIQRLDPETNQPTTQTVEELLKDLFKAYDPTAQYSSSTTQKLGNYYALDVDEDGYGVWLYLCPWEDILKETAYDTGLGAPASELQETTESKRFILDMVFTGQNTPR